MTYHVGVDVGGTFTDVYVFDQDAGSASAKALTTPNTVDGVMDALAKVVDVGEIEAFTFGSTIATNALVTRAVARTGLLATAGFRDLLDIRRAWRRDLFGHAWDRPASLVARELRHEATERIDWRGDVVVPLDEDDVRRAARAFADAEVEAVAVAFLFSYLDDRHERRAGEILREMLPGVPVLLSSEVNPERKEYERTSTTVSAASLTPIVDGALGRLERRLEEHGLRAPLRVMKSNGGVMSAQAGRRKPIELVKSGPAGGAGAGTHLAEQLGENLILVDIGGTTADVSLIVDGRPVRADQDVLEWDVPIRVPVVDIRSVGAGGGSIAAVDAADGLRVGPRSAGSVPGPAAYGRGGSEPTVTDAAVVSGILSAEGFLDGEMALDADAARIALEPLAAAIGLPLERAAAAVMHVATTEMARLVREITIDQGHDPRDFTLVAFGGAGGMFAGPLLDELEMTRGIVPVGASTWSAMGGTFADVTFDYVRSEVGIAADVTVERLREAFGELLGRARRDMEAEGLPDAREQTAVALRYAGQHHEIEVPYVVGDDLSGAVAAFEREHERLWGHRRDDEPVELIDLRVHALAERPKPTLAAVGPAGTVAPRGRRPVAVYPADAAEAPVFRREDLGDGWSVAGPAIVEEAQTTVLATAGSTMSLDSNGNLVISR